MLETAKTLCPISCDLHHLHLIVVIHYNSSNTTMLSHPGTDVPLTPDRSLSEDRKRKRDVLSCLDCRRRKMKCDRALPACGRCQKGGIADSCTYRSLVNGDDQGSGGDRPVELKVGQSKRPRLSYYGQELNKSPHTNQQDELPSRAPALSTQETTVKKLEARLAELERVVGRYGTAREPVKEHGASATPAGAREPETFFFKGKGFKTQFYGATLPLNQLAHVGSLLCISFQELTSQSFPRCVPL